MIQSALIQGGASGLGQALVDRVLKSGEFEQIFVTARNCSRITTEDSRVIPIELDLMSDTSINEASERIASHTDKLHLSGYDRWDSTR